jgi:hypothetical protein
MSDNNERPADLLFWFADGFCGTHQARTAASTRVSIGRTNSKRALGFTVSNGEKMVADFVLDRDQVGELASFLQVSASGLRKPLGRKRQQLNLATAILNISSKQKGKRT